MTNIIYTIDSNPAVNDCSKWGCIMGFPRSTVSAYPPPPCLSLGGSAGNSKRRTVLCIASRSFCLNVFFKSQAFDQVTCLQGLA